MTYSLAEMAHRSLCGEYLNLSIVPSFSAAFQTNAISCVPCDSVNKGLVPIHYKYFVRNLTLQHSLLNPGDWGLEHSRFNKPYSDIITKTITKAHCVSHHATLEYYRTFLGISHRQRCNHMYTNVHVRHLQAWMFQAFCLLY